MSAFRPRDIESESNWIRISTEKTSHFFPAPILGTWVTKQIQSTRNLGFLFYKNYNFRQYLKYVVPVAIIFGIFDAPVYTHMSSHLVEINELKTLKSNVIMQCCILYRPTVIRVFFLGGGGGSALSHTGYYMCCEHVTQAYFNT